MKVCVVSEAIYTHLSGAAIFTQRIIEQLSLRGLDVVVITDGEKKSVKAIGNKTFYSFPALKFEKLKNFPLPLFNLLDIKRILEKEKPDAMHIQLPTLLCGAALYYAKKLGIPAVITSHTQSANILWNLNIKSEKASRIIDRYIAKAYSFADHIVCPSEHAKKELIQNRMNLSVPMSVISNGIDSNYFVPGKKRDKTVLFVGRLMKEKCIPALIKASSIVKKSHPDYRFVIAGDGYMRQALEKIAQSINPDIVFTGRLKDKELLELYQKASIFALPSDSELQGLVLLEAMSCGVPTISSDSKNSAARELSNLLFRHNDHRDLARKINNLIEDKKEWHRLSENNRSLIVREHDFSNIISKYIRVYESAIAKKKDDRFAKNARISSNAVKSNVRVKRKIRKLDFESVKGFFSAKYLNRPYPMWIDLRITSRCNLRCIYCSIPDSRIPEMGFEEVKKVIDKVDIPSWILLTGGEPLMRHDIGEIIDYVVFNSKHKIILNSNLIMLKQKYHEIKNCDGFYFSLDGSKETHEKNKGKGTWKPTIEALELLHSEKRGKISMTVITSNTNMKDILEVLRLCKKYEITPAFQLVRHYSMSKDSKTHSPEMKNAVKIFDFLIKERKKGLVMMNSLKGLKAQKKLAQSSIDEKCFSGKLFCTIDSDGLVGLCFSRPRQKGFLNLKDKKVTWEKAISALAKIRPDTVRCAGCSCMAPIEFALCGLLSFDVMYHNNQSFTKFIKLENDYVERVKEKKKGW